MNIRLAGIMLPAALLAACDGGGRPEPPAPTGLVAQGSLGNIHLRWGVSTSLAVEGYNVYRSVDEQTWTKMNSSAVGATTYDDPISSPAGDGVFYKYRVTALGATESPPSTTVRAIHGTRLPAHSSAGFITEVAKSPYVAEGTVVVDGGHLVVSPFTKLYVLDHAVVDLERWSATTGYLWVRGLLHVLATPDAPATFTAHRVGGTLADDEGFTFWFDGADGSGSLLQNALVTNLAWGNSNGGFFFTGGSPRLYNLHVTSNSATGGSYLRIFAGAGPVIQHCQFTRMTLLVATDLRSTSFRMDHVRFRGGYYAIWFANLASPGVAAGQIELNDFDGTREAYLYDVNAASPIPLGNNHWSGGTGSPPVPPLLLSGSTAQVDFGAALMAPPPAVGPTWQP